MLLDRNHPRAVRQYTVTPDESDAVGAAAARRTGGLVRPDHHADELVGADGGPRR